MAFVTTDDGAEIYYKDWGSHDARPIVFHHGWPLSADDWDAQMLFFLSQGYRVIASDRRRHGRSSQIGTGHDMDHYEGIKVFSETDQTEDRTAITVPVLVMQGDDDQVVPYKDAAIKQAEVLQNATLKIYEGYPHGMLTTHADVINPTFSPSSSSNTARRKRRTRGDPRVRRLRVDMGPLVTPLRGSAEQRSRRRPSSRSSNGGTRWHATRRIRPERSRPS
jgi:pimeloyl-ACP methyl ester carboxylesterase